MTPSPLPETPKPRRLHSGLIVPLSKIEPSSLNPRKHFDPAQLRELADALKEGQHEDLIVRPHPTKPDHYELADGERRWRAAQLGGMDSLRVNVDDLTDTQMVEIGLVTYLQKVGLNEIEEATGYSRLMSDSNLTVEQISDRIGKGRSKKYVYDRLKLLEGTPAVVNALVSGDLSAGHGILLARLQPADQDEQLKWLLGVKKAGQEVTVRQLDQRLDNEVRRPLAKAEFPIKDAALLPEAGSCLECPKREAGTKKGEQGKCLDARCYRAKVEAFVQIQLTRLSAEKRPFYKLSSEYYDPKLPADILVHTEWTEAQPKQAGAKVGLIVHGSGGQIGKAMEIILTKERDAKAREAGKAEATKKRAQARTQRIERAVRFRALQVIGTEIGQSKADAAITKTIRALVQSMVETWRQPETILELHGQPGRKPKENWKGPQTRFGQLAARSMKQENPLRLLTEMLLCPEITPNTMSPRAEAFNQLAGYHGIDLKKLRKEETAKLAPKKKAKTKKKAAKKAPKADRAHNALTAAARKRVAAAKKTKKKAKKGK